MDIIEIDKNSPDFPKIITEDDFEQQMHQVVEPYLSHICKSGLISADLPLYYEIYPCPQAKGTIVISHGFTEASCKFHEFIYYILSQGYQAAILDHRGHGKSLREVSEAYVVHVKSFDHYVDDLHQFLHQIVLPNLLPLQENKQAVYLYAHSMGGCIGVRYLEKYPKDFAKAILNAPMLGVNAGKCPSWVILLICRINILLGRANKPIFIHSSYNIDDPFDGRVTDSEKRHNYYRTIRREDTCYQTNAASYRWLLESVRTTRKILKKDETLKIECPILLFQAALDFSVSAKAQLRFIKRVPNGTLLVVPDSRHEIYRNSNRVLVKYLTAVFDFYN